jgi:hypothetical protein
MSVDMQMDYDHIEDMVAAFRRAIGRMDQARANMQQAVGILQGGGLVGTQGNQLLALIVRRIVPVTNAGAAKFQEMIGDLTGAMNDTRTADSDASNRFS